MKIGKKIYEFTSKELKQKVQEVLDNRKRCWDAWRKFSRKVGAMPRYALVSDNFHGGGHLLALKFAKQPDLKLWRSTDDGEYWKPRRNTKEGRAIWKEFKELPEWDATPLMEAVKWKGIYHACRFYNFSYFAFENGFCGMTAPVFDEDSYKNDKQLKYNPVPGMKEITWGQYERKSKWVSKTSRKSATKPTKRTVKRSETTASLTGN